MYYAIFILPNSGDAWETASPFSTLLGSGHLGFCFSNQVASSLTEYTLISSKLLDVSDIDRSVDIFSGSSSEIKGGVSLNGVGGVATSGDFSFTLEKTGIDPLKLLGRTVKVTLDLVNSSIRDLGYSGVNDKFTGKIRKVNPGRQSIELVCSGLLAILREKEVGTLSNYESDVYKSKIIPIVYGDFTDENAMVEVILDNNVKNNPAIIIDSQPMTSIDNICIFDVDTKTKINYNNGNIDNLKITDNKKIDIVVDNGLTLRDAVNDTPGVVALNVYDPPIIAIECSEDLSTLVAGTDGVLWNTVSFYSDNSGSGIIMEYHGVIDGYHTFTCPNIRPELTTWNKYLGPGPDTITPTWVSEIIDPVIVRQERGIISVDSPMIEGSDTSETILSIDSEYFLVYETSVSAPDLLYAYTGLSCMRGFKDSIEAAHLASTPVYVNNGCFKSTWKFNHTVWCSGVSNFKTLVDSAPATNIPVAGDIDDLTKMNRTGVMGDPVQFSILETLSSIFYLDLSFPKLGVKGNVVNAYLQGFYRVSTAAAKQVKSSLSVFQSGSKVVETYILLPRTSTVGMYIQFTGGVGRRVTWPIDPVGSAPIAAWGVDLSEYIVKYSKSSNIAFPLIAFEEYHLHDVTNEHNSLYLLTYPIDAYSETGEKTYSLANKIDNLRDSYTVIGINPGEYYRDCPLGDIASFLSQNLVLRWEQLATPEIAGVRIATLQVANPGLLLEMEINPLESKIYVQGTGRGAINTPQGILIDILDKELSFTNVSDQTVDRANWMQSVNLANDIVSFGDIAQSICEQGGLILSELTDGYLTIHDLTMPSDTSVLTTITDAHIILENNISAIEEEWTTIDRLITDLTVSYAYNAAGEYYSATMQSSEISNVASKLNIAHAILDEDRKATVSLPFVRNAFSANAVGNLIAEYNTTPLRTLTVKLIPSMHGLSVGQWVNCNIAGIYPGKVYLIVGYNLDLRGIVTVRLLEMVGVPSTQIVDGMSAYGSANDWQDTTTVYGNDNDKIDKHT
jgi:hypothetical protein